MDKPDPGSTNGFLLSRQWKERPDGYQDLVFWLTTETGPVRVTVESEESVFFLQDSVIEAARKVLGTSVSWHLAVLALKSFNHEPVYACYFRDQKAMNHARLRLEQAGIYALEADIRPTDRYLMERFIQGTVAVHGHAEEQAGYRSYLNPSLKPVAFLPELKVISLDIETSWTDNVLYSIGIYGTGIRKVFMVSGEISADLEYLEFQPDEKVLIIRFLEWFRGVDPDVIIGWNVVGFDVKFLQDRCRALGITFSLGRAGEAVQWRTVADRHYALVPGRVVLDGIELLRTATYNFESFALDYVASALLGRGKLVKDVDARASEIQQMFTHDKTKLAEYNLEDCVLVWEIFRETDLIEFAIERCRMTGLDMDRAGGSVAAFDFLYLPRLHRAGFVAPVVSPDAGVGGPGGYVLDSKPDLYDHVIVLDFKSLYPSIIRTFHVDPLAMICADREADAIPGFDGGRFSRDHYILPNIIEELWADRDKAREAGKSAMSQAIKIIMNSFYGVLGTRACRFFDSRLVSSITRRGHEILKRTRDLIEERGLTVIYGDTDSLFVLLHGVSTAHEARRLGIDLAEHLNQWWNDYLEQSIGVDSCLEVEFETHFDRFLMPRIRGSEQGSKKRYAGLIRHSDGSHELVFKGLETVRSDWSQLAREFQQELYRRIFLDEHVEQFIRDTVERVQTGECDEKLVLRRRVRRRLNDYVKNVPPHVRAARNAEEIRRRRGLSKLYQQGSWVEYVMTVNGPEPEAYRESPIDYQFYIDKQLAPVADAILSFRSTSLADITDKQLGLF